MHVLEQGRLRTLLNLLRPDQLVIWVGQLLVESVAVNALAAIL